MEFTDNLKLTQYSVDDVTSWITGYSSDMRKIDDAFGDVTNTTSVSNMRLEAVEADVTQLNTDADKMAVDIAVNSTSVSNAIMEIKTLTERETTHYDAITAEIDSIKENQERDGEAITVLQANTSTIRDMVAVNTSSINKLQVRVTTLEEAVDSNQTANTAAIQKNTEDIEKLKTDLTDTDAIARKAEVDAEAAVNTSSVASARVVELTAYVEKNTNDIDELNGKIDGDINTRITENTNSISELTQKVNNNEQNIANIDTEMGTLNSRLESLEDGGAAVALTQRVTALETWEGTAKTQITNAQSAADQANTIANNVQSQVSGIKSGASVPFSFGVDSEGNYGYKKEGADTVTPFLRPLDYDTAISDMLNGIDMPTIAGEYGLNIAGYVVAIIDNLSTGGDKWIGLFAKELRGGGSLVSMRNNYMAGTQQYAIQDIISKCIENLKRDSVYVSQDSSIYNTNIIIAMFSDGNAIVDCPTMRVLLRNHGNENQEVSIIIGRYQMNR